MTAKTKFEKLGSVRKNEDGQYLKFNDTVSVMIDGREAEMNKSRSASINLGGSGFELGTITLGKIEIGKILKGKEGKSNYIKFNTNVSFKINNVAFKANTSNAANLQDPVKTVEVLFEKGYIKEEDIEKRRDQAKQNSTWLMYEVSMSPAT